jgi:hypothetical protein
MTPSHSTAKEIQKSKSEFFSARYHDTQRLLAVGCDGTATNTGKIGGIIRLIEHDLNKPLQWLICQLHANELPLRHLMNKVDGNTNGPLGFSGPIGQQLSHCQTMSVIEFEKIETELPEITKIELSTDQRYLFDICHAVSTGHCPEDLALKDPGKMAHSRWITTANRILRLYVSTTNPTTQLHMLAEYVAKVYAPMWFKIKFKPSCKDGARHVFETVHRVQGLPQQVKQVVEPVIQRNAYFAHPENLLLSMLSDQRMHIRELGLRRILKARTVNSRKIRKFDIPKLNFAAQDYTDLIDWQNVTVTSPPLLMKVPDDEVKASILSGNPLEFEKLPCHTQAVERCIKLVTEASTAVCGAAARDGFINVRNEARKKMPRFETKNHFAV